MKKTAVLLLGLSIGALQSFGFVPPLTLVFKTCYEGRKPQPTETVFRHQVTLRTGEVLNIEEKLAEIGGKTYLTFRSPTYGEVGATWNRGLYAFGSDRKISSKSQAFVSFFTLQSSDRFRDVLLDENFLRRDQFEQYRTGFVPQGDPATWDIKAGYIVHPLVFFSKAPAGFAIVAAGSDDLRARKAVFFDKEKMVVSRFEWREGNQTTAWNFQNFKKVAGDGTYPFELSFAIEDKEVIKTAVVNRQYLKGKTRSQWLERFSNLSKNPLNPQMEEALKLLLSYR
ncbi:hypothetical protein EBR03_02030 [bacterium]|nr:hypothetical protein [bacterium]